MNQILVKIKEFFLKHETKIVLFVGFCLISAISFEFGVMQGQKWQQKPLVIEKPVNIPEGQSSANQGILEAQGASKTAFVSPEPNSKSYNPTANSSLNCAFVGSKNSTKFYLPTCSYAKRVKPENMVCFKSADEALGQGRTESKCK